MATDTRVTGNPTNKHAPRRGMKMLVLAALTLAAFYGVSPASAQTVYAGKINVDNDKDRIYFVPPESILLVPPGGTGVRFRADYRLLEKKLRRIFTSARIRIEREVGEFGSDQWEPVWSDRKTVPKNADTSGSFQSPVIEQTQPVVRYRIHLRGKFGGHYRHCVRTKEELHRCESKISSGGIVPAKLPIAIVVKPPARGGQALTAALGASRAAALAYQQYPANLLAIADEEDTWALENAKYRLIMNALTFVEGGKAFQAMMEQDGKQLGFEMGQELLENVRVGGKFLGRAITAEFLLADYLEATINTLQQLSADMNKFYGQTCFHKAMNAIRDGRASDGYESMLAASARIIQALESYGYGDETSAEDLHTLLAEAEANLAEATHALDGAQNDFFTATLIGGGDGSSGFACGAADPLSLPDLRGEKPGDIHEKAVRRGMKFFEEQQRAVAQHIFATGAFRFNLENLRTLEVIARNDRPAPVKLKAQGYDANGFALFDTTLTWAASNNQYSAQSVEVPATTSMFVLTYTNDVVTGSGEDGDRNAVIDYLDWAGLRIEGENYEHETGCAVRHDQNASGGKVAHCPMYKDSVAYRLPTPPPDESAEEEPAAPPQPNWVAESDDPRELKVAALNDKPGPVELRAQGYDDKAFALFDVTLTWDANDNSYSSQAIRVPGETRMLGLSFLADADQGGGADGDRNAYIDYVEWTGLRLEAEGDAVGSPHWAGCEMEVDERASGERVMLCDQTGDAVLFRLPSPPPPDWIADSAELRDLEVTALNDKPGPVRLRAQGHDDQGAAQFDVTLTWAANDNRYSTQAKRVPAATDFLVLTFFDDVNSGGGVDDDRNAYIDYLNWGGVRIEGEDFNHASGCQYRDRADTHGSAVAYCDQTNTAVMYRLPSAPPDESAEDEPAAPPPEQPVAGAAQLKIITLNDRPGPVTLKTQGFDDKGTVTLDTTLSWAANDNSYSAKAIDLPGGTRRVRLTFMNDSYRAGGPDRDRNAFIDYLEWGGQRIEAENFNRTGGQRGDPGCNKRLQPDTFGSRVADCGNRGDFVEYDLP